MGELEVIAEPGVPQVRYTRELDAPLDLVVRAYVEPELVAQWLGPRGYETVIDRFEARDGGRWRYVHHGPDGSRDAFHGVFHGTPSRDGIVQTFEYEGWPGLVSLDTVSFEERDGRTIVRSNSVFQSVEFRDAMVEHGMQQGVEEGFERLDELLGRLGGQTIKTRHD
jgi:uncharacterized protein YndB with AHSA1/START domain